MIKDFANKYDFILDPHTATAVGASNRFNNNSDTIVLGTAHPYKFSETIKKATGKKIEPPKQMNDILDKKEKFDILENEISTIKNYIFKKIA